MADAPAGGAGAKLDPQALIAKHAAVTQSGAGGDAAVVARVENSIKNSPMGWLQGMLGETSARATSEQGEVHGKLAESQDLVAKNSKDAPKEEGPAPAPGPAAHPAVPHPAVAAAPAPVTQRAETPGPAETHEPIAAKPVAKSAAPAAPPAPAPTIAAATAAAGGDQQLDGILNAYTPKSPQTTQTLGRIKQMGDVANGFSGQLDVYVSQGGAIDSTIAGASNFLGVGKDAGAVWRNNPYRRVHGVLGGIMTGMSAVKSVCSIVGSICGKLGMVLTVIGLLGMIFPPIGAAVSGIARILSVVGMICDAISFVLSGILTGLNGVVLAQQISAGASAEEKAATADMMVSEANEAASGFTNLAMAFGPKFMKGLLGSSKGIVASLIKNAKATIGRVAMKVSANVGHFANKIVRKMGFGGAKFARVGGAWKDTGMVAGMKEKWADSMVGKAFNGAPAHIQGVQDKLMGKYGNTTWAKNMDRVGAWGGSVANKFDLEDKVGKMGESSGKWVGGLGADTKLGKSLAGAAERSETQTRELAMKLQARDASHLEESRWKNELSRRQAANPDHVREPGAENKFVANQGQKVRDEADTKFQADEKKRAMQEKAEKMRGERFDRRNEEFYENKTNGITGESARDEMMSGVHNTREKRWKLEADFKTQETERKELLGKATKTAEEQSRLTALNSELRPLDEARRVNKMYETDLSGLAQGKERVREPDYKNWHDVASNAWEATAPVLEMMHLKDQDSAWAMAEKANLKKQTKYNKGTAKANAVGRGGGGTFDDIATDARHAEMDEITAFVRATPQSATLTSRVGGMLSPITSRAVKPQVAAPAPAPVVTPAPTPSAAPAVAPVAVAVHEEAAPVVAPPVQQAEPAKEAEPDEAGGEALPYWPALLPEFEKASHDFGYMRNVAVEFKKAQIEGKQKAVDTLAVYGRYKEYAALRQDAAKKNQAGAASTQGATQQNVGHAAQTEGQAGQGEAKQGEAKGAANDKAATDLPEPESRGFWGRILGAVKRWAKNKAAQVFGWIQEKIASVILQGLCGVSMGDMREYAGALRSQQQAAHGVAGEAGATSANAASTSIKLGSDATKEAQSAADAIGECDKNIVDADNFMADVSSFEQQLAEEKANAQIFIAQVQAAAHAEQARKQQEAAAQHAEQAKDQANASALGSPTPQAAEPTPAPAPTAELAHADAPEPEGEGDTAQIHAAADYVATESDSMASKLDARANDYINQLALALTNRTGKNAEGVDLKGPAKTESKHIVEEFKKEAASSRTDMEAFHTMPIEPQQAKRIAEQIIQGAQHLEASYTQSENALDELFARTYNGIKEGKRTLKSRLFDGDNAVGKINQVGDEVESHAIDTSLPAMNAAWNKVSAPIQVAPKPTVAPTPAAAPPTMLAMNDTAPPPPMMFKGAAGEEPVDTGTDLRKDGGGQIPFRAEMERAFGQDFSNVRATYGAHGAMDELGARGVTQGEHITFAQTSPDKELVAHELTHVVQQRRGGANANPKPEGVSANERGGLESEADKVSARVAGGDHAGEIAGQTSGTGFRDDAPGAADVFPPAQILQVVGDRFTLTFRKAGNKAICDVKYTGALETLGNATQAMEADLSDPTRKFNARITNVSPTGVTVDLYGDGLTVATFTDNAKPDKLGDRNVRYHAMSWKVGQFGQWSTMTLYLPKDGAADGAQTLKFHAVDEFDVSVVRFGDAKSVAVTISGTGVAANPQTVEVPIHGDMDKIHPKVLKNDGRTIAFDFDNDGKADLTLIHTIGGRTEGQSQIREHHFRQFDADGVLIGTYRGGMLFVNIGPVVAIPAAQDEHTNAPDVDKEAPFSRPTAQADNAGELPVPNAGPGGIIEMRVDGDGDRTKELAVRLKPMPGSSPEAPGQIKVEVIQISSVAATNAAGSMVAPASADALKTFKPWVTQVADGFNPTIIQLSSSGNAPLELKISPPTNNDAAKTRSYAVEIGGMRQNMTFPAETTPENPLVKSAAAATTVGNVTRLEATLGEFGDRFWVMHEPQPNGKDMMSIAAINADGPAASQNVTLDFGKPITSFTKVDAGGNNLALDLDGDGRADVRIFDAMSQPVGMTFNKPVLNDRDHTITVVGAGASQKLYPFLVREGKFTQHEPDKEATAGSHAVAILSDQADDSRSKDENGIAKEGDINALMSRIAGALTAARLRAKQAHMISDKLYDSWAKLSEELIALGPQINAKKVDAKLQGLAAQSAGDFCAELTEATKGEDKTISATEGSTTIGNDYTQKITTIAAFYNHAEGPTLRLQNEIQAGAWGKVTSDFNSLVTGLDSWIAAKMKPGSDEQKQQQYLVGMQGKMAEINGKPGIQRVMASFQPDASYNSNTQKWGQIPLMLFSWKENGKWYLKDITSPDREFTDTIAANDSDKEPPASIFQQLDYAKHFPKGVLHYQIPGGSGGQIITTERKSWTDFLQWVGLGLAVVGFSLATFGTGAVAATAAAVAFAAAGVASAVYAGGDLYERAKHGDLEPAAVAMDLAQIAAGIFGAGAAISGRIVAAAAQADIAAANGVEGAAAWSGAAARVASFSQKLYIPALAASAGADGVNLLAMGADTISKIQQIKDGEGSPEDKKGAIAALIAQTLILGGITIMSIKGSMPEIMGGRPTIAIDIVNGIPIARTSSISVGETKIAPKGDANAQATARWQSHAFEETIPLDPKVKALSDDKPFMKGYQAWMEQPEPKVTFVDGKPKANFGKDVVIEPAVKAKIQGIVDQGIGVSLYEKAWSNADQLKKVEDAIKAHGGKLDTQPGSKGWTDARPEIVKSLGGNAQAEEMVSRYERSRVGADGGDARTYATQRAQLERVIPETEIDRIHGIFKGYEVYISGGATQTNKLVNAAKLDDVDVIVVVPRDTPPELCAAIEARARGQLVRPDPAFLQANGLPADKTLTLDVKVMTDEQFFGFSTASNGKPKAGDDKAVSPLNFTRIDVEPEAVDAAIAKGGSGQQWLDRLEKRLDPAAMERVKTRMARPYNQTAQDIMSEFSGDFELAVGELSKSTGDKPASAMTTVKKYTNGPMPDGPAVWGYAENKANWKPDRVAQQDQWIATAKAQAQQFADAIETANPNAEATIFAMRGNTAAGKTRAVTSNVPAMQKPMAATATVQHRAVNPDNFKLEIYKTDPGMTSTQVHMESSILAKRLENELLGLKTSDGKAGSILIDKRLASVTDVSGYIKMAKDSGRKFVLYDVDAPLEASLTGVLERAPGGNDPLPPFDIVAGGFTSVRNDRLDVIKLFQEPGTGTYTLYGTRADGARVEIANVSETGALTITNAELFTEATAPAAAQAQLIGAKRINDQSIGEITASLPPDRAQKIAAILRKYEGWTWREALDAHAVEKPAPTPEPGK